jgi:hypothetical protein
MVTQDSSPVFCEYEQNRDRNVNAQRVVQQQKSNTCHVQMLLITWGT